MVLELSVIKEHADRMCSRFEYYASESEDGKADYYRGVADGYSEILEWIKDNE